MKRLSNARARACDIPQKVKTRVWERDEGCCVICGGGYNTMPNAHFHPRSDGGLGIEENIFTACTRLTENDCHHRFDNDAEFRAENTPRIIEHFKNHYPDWDESKLIYRKYGL